MKSIGLIPARYSSTRFPGKPLAVINGKTMIQRVYEQAKSSKMLSDVIVATDDERIQEHVKNFGGKVIMTSAEHKSGTERCNEVIQHLSDKYDIAVNIQGDEPYISQAQIDKVVSCFENKNVQIATLSKKITSQEELFNVNTVKVITDKNHKAVYFSRHPIPYYKDKPEDEWCTAADYYKHIGIYAYRVQILKAIVKLTPSHLEIAESLEQLRWIENGFNIFVEHTDIESISVDTPEDLLKIEKIFKD